MNVVRMLLFDSCTGCLQTICQSALPLSRGVQLWQVAMLEGAIAFLEQQQDDPGDFRDAATDASEMSAPELIKEEEYAGEVFASETLLCLYILSWNWAGFSHSMVVSEGSAVVADATEHSQMLFALVDSDDLLTFGTLQRCDLLELLSSAPLVSKVCSQEYPCVSHSFHALLQVILPVWLLSEGQPSVVVLADTRFDGADIVQQGQVCRVVSSVLLRVACCLCQLRRRTLTGVLSIHPSHSDLTDAGRCL